MRMRNRMTRTVALLSALAFMLAAGCGLKPGVAQMYGPGGTGYGQQGVAPGQPGLPGEQGMQPGALGGTGQDAVPGATAPGQSQAGATRTGGTGGTAGSGGPTSGPGGAGGPGGPGGPGDTTGVTDKTIKIGVHAPVTGAAAFPQKSFERAVGVYASYINSKGGVNGRKIEVLFRDDKFDPNHARAVCKDLAEQQKVFMIIGGAGSDQIDSCARYANSVGVPYISAGVHETRPGLGSLAKLRTYYASSLTYEQQAPLVTRLVTSQFEGKKVGLMVADNDSLDNYFAVQQESLERAIGDNLEFAERVPKNIQSEAPSIAAEICNSGVEAVVWMGSPSGLINVTKSMTCTVRFLGAGNTNGLNIVAEGGCPQLDNAQFFSSFPQLDKINQMDPNFEPAYRKKNNGEDPDDIGIAMWGAEKLVSMMLDAGGKDLSRQSFMAALESGKTFDNNVYPPVNFGKSRFGGTAMHQLRADCGQRQFFTERLNVR
ncbi:MAG: ABC transporter substrate-binding protein [Actinophytocola sp.]|nr:ABC transporter substrate-binding protein [Actinophytocola sp.]